MDDFKILLLKLNCEPQPLTEKESEMLDKIQNGLKGTNASENADEELEKPNFNWITKPEELVFSLDCEVNTTTVFETDNVILVSKTASSSKYSTISEAVENAAENATIIIDGTINDETVKIDKPLHFISKDENTSVVNTVFEVLSGGITFSGINFTTDFELFSVVNGGLSLKGCKVDSTSTKPVIALNENVSFEMIGSSIKAQKALDVQNGSFVNVQSSVIEGNNHIIKSATSFTNCSLSNPTGISIEAHSAVINVKNSLVTKSKNVALSITEHCNFSIENTTIKDIKGAGILLHGFTRMQGKNIYLTKCNKAGLIIAHNSSAEISGSVISKCDLAGCEILNQGQLTLNETWISEHKGSCILSDKKSFITITRCMIQKGRAHGIEAVNGSTIRINDTCVTECRGSGVLVSSSKITSMMCEYSKNTEANIVGEDGSFIELTNCSILYSRSDGIEVIGGAVNVNACYFSGCRGMHLVGKGIKDAKIVSSTFRESLYTKGGKLIASDADKQNESQSCDVYGGISFEQSEMIIIDRCHLFRNSVYINSCKNCIARDSYFIFCVTKSEKIPARYFEAVYDSNMVVEGCFLKRTHIKVKHSTATIRKCTIQQSTNFEIYGCESANIIVEHNTMSSLTQIASIKDNSTLNFSFNKVTNVIRPKKKAENETSVYDELRSRALYIKEFSKSTIEGNFISGDYDWALYIDGQSQVDCVTNQIQSGTKGGVIYTGMSYGKCDDNEFTGKTKFVEFYNGASTRN